MNFYYIDDVDSLSHSVTSLSTLLSRPSERLWNRRPHEVAWEPDLLPQALGRRRKTQRNSIVVTSPSLLDFVTTGHSEAASCGRCAGAFESLPLPCGILGDSVSTPLALRPQAASGFYPFFSFSDFQHCSTPTSLLS